MVLRKVSIIYWLWTYINWYLVLSVILGYYIIEEGDIMATSSIFTSVIINTEKEAKELITALENAEKAPRVLIDDPDIEYISDHD